MYDLPPEALEEPGLQHAAKTGINDDVAALPDNLPAVLHVDEGETVYDYAWYPGMLASEPASCVFATTVRVWKSPWRLPCPSWACIHPCLQSEGSGTPAHAWAPQ